MDREPRFDPMQSVYVKRLIYLKSYKIPSRSLILTKHLIFVWFLWDPCRPQTSRPFNDFRSHGPRTSPRAAGTRTVLWSPVLGRIDTLIIRVNEWIFTWFENDISIVDSYIKSFRVSKSPAMIRKGFHVHIQKRNFKHIFSQFNKMCFLLRKINSLHRLYPLHRLYTDYKLMLCLRESFLVVLGHFHTNFYIW